MLKIAFFLGEKGGGIYAQAFKQQNYVYYCEIKWDWLILLLQSTAADKSHKLENKLSYEEKRL